MPAVRTTVAAYRDGEGPMPTYPHDAPGHPSRGASWRDAGNKVVAVGCAAVIIVVFGAVALISAIAVMAGSDALAQLVIDSLGMNVVAVAMGSAFAGLGAWILIRVVQRWSRPDIPRRGRIVALAAGAALIAFGVALVVSGVAGSGGAAGF